MLSICNCSRLNETCLSSLYILKSKFESVMAALYFLQSQVVTIFVTINYLTNALHLYANYLIKIEVELWALSVPLFFLLFWFLKLKQFQAVNAQSRSSFVPCTRRMTCYAVLAFINLEVQVGVPVTLQHNFSFCVTQIGKRRILGYVVRIEDAVLGLSSSQKELMALLCTRFPFSCSCKVICIVICFKKNQ